jgi:ribonuclease HI
MPNLMLFTDASVNTRSRIGIGAYLVVGNMEISLDDLKSKIILRQFEGTASTRLELQTLLWALSDGNFSKYQNITVFTDSQNIVGLLGRRNRLEQSDFNSGDKKRLNNAEFYKEFYKVVDLLNITFVKVEGHKKKDAKDHIDKIFTLVDRAARAASRNM